MDGARLRRGSATSGEGSAAFPTGPGFYKSGDYSPVLGLRVMVLDVGFSRKAKSQFGIPSNFLHRRFD